MRQRPKNAFLQSMQKASPSVELRKQFISCFKSNGLSSFEFDVLPMMGKIGLNHFQYIDGFGKMLFWRYVGDYWWCRKCERVYEFARIMAVQNTPDMKVVGLWDARLHISVPQPEIVYKGGIRGYIVGYNDFEVLIEWEDSVSLKRNLAVSVRNIDGLSFEFEDDYLKYNKIFTNISKRSG